MLPLCSYPCTYSIDPQLSKECFKVLGVFVVFQGGVGFDINCGVRLLRTNLHERDVQPVKEQLAQVCKKFLGMCSMDLNIF